jgi:hypothetical protein
MVGVVASVRRPRAERSPASRRAYRQRGEPRSRDSLSPGAAGCSASLIGEPLVILLPGFERELERRLETRAVESGLGRREGEASRDALEGTGDGAARRGV